VALARRQRDRREGKDCAVDAVGERLVRERIGAAVDQGVADIDLVADVDLQIGQSAAFIRITGVRRQAQRQLQRTALRLLTLLDLCRGRRGLRIRGNGQRECLACGQRRYPRYQDGLVHVDGPLDEWRMAGQEIRCCTVLGMKPAFADASRPCMPAS
jgi:hypothetical protein